MEAVDTVATAGQDVFAHNVEVVRRLQRTVRDVRCGYDLSLDVLRRAKAAFARLEDDKRRLTKSSIMVGVGETDEEVIGCLGDLRAADVDVVTIGQYLRPTPKHLAVARFVHPDMSSRTTKSAPSRWVFSTPPRAPSFGRATAPRRCSCGASSAAPAKRAPSPTARWIDAIAARLETARREVARVEAGPRRQLVPPRAPSIRRPVGNVPP